MIIVKLIGGLGNQMFQFATGRALALKHGVELKLDVSQLNKDAAGAYTQRKLELDVFNFNFQIANEKEISTFENLNNNKALRFLQRKAPFLFSKLYFAESGSVYQSTFNSLPKNTYLEGFWQSEKYFVEIRNTLLKEFVIKEKPTENTQFWIDKIKSTNSISVHVRRGDYVNLKTANDFHGLCSVEYYINAVKKITAEKKHFEVFVFSDDIAWCQQNLTFDLPTYYIVHNQKAVWDMYLMGICNYNIIANSSFSWWGAWLNQNTNKQVLVPEYWYTNVKSNSIDILAKDWNCVSAKK